MRMYIFMVAKRHGKSKKKKGVRNRAKISTAIYAFCTSQGQDKVWFAESAQSRGEAESTVQKTARRNETKAMERISFTHAAGRFSRKPDILQHIANIHIVP